MALTAPKVVPILVDQFVDQMAKRIQTSVFCGLHDVKMLNYGIYLWCLQENVQVMIILKNLNNSSLLTLTEN